MLAIVSNAEVFLTTGGAFGCLPVEHRVHAIHQFPVLSLPKFEIKESGPQLFRFGLDLYMVDDFRTGDGNNMIR